MEEDVRLPQDERPGGSEGQRGSLVHPDFITTTTIQSPQPQQPERYGSRKRLLGDSARPVISTTSFSRLPRTVIEYILYVADASTFSSLTLLNRKWRRISNSAVLYAHHLSQCPSFSLSQKATAGQTTPENLPLLKVQFFSEIRRNGFDVFLRPHKTLIKLISTSMSSSTAFPQGEAFRFAFSQNAQLVLCISSSRIVVLDVTSESASVRHELKTWRRPLHASILDDGSLLAVVSSTHQVNIYSLSSSEAKLIQNLKLNDVPRALALSPTGGVLAIAYNDMIEVYAVGEGVLATERRAVRCSGVDSVSFSCDGIILLGSSTNCQTGGLVTISVPFYNEQEADFSAKDIQIQMWTSQILFPDTVQGYSHACLLPLHTEGEGGWILGFDNQVGAFRAIGVNNANSGTTYFVSPLSDDGVHEQPPVMLATADCQGELVALGFRNSGIWVYGVPDRLDIAPVANNSSQQHASPNSSQTQSDRATTSRTNMERLRRSVTRPKVLIDGHKMADMPGITAARWVRHNDSVTGQRRLAAVAPGGVDPPIFGEEDVPIDGGRVLLLDFARSVQNGSSTEINIEIGEAEPMILQEPNSSLDTEVELERRRTRIIRGSSAGPPSRAFRESFPAATSSFHARPRRNSSYLSATSSEPGDIEAPGIPDSPYDNTQPRSQDTLRRATTAAAVNRRRETRWLREEPRRAYGNRIVPPTFQIPHESDADNWVPPPPPYSKDPDSPLPDHLRRTLLPQAIEPTHRAGNAPDSIRRSLSARLESMVTDSSSWASMHRLNTVSGPRLASRTRRHLMDTSGPSDSPRRQANFLQTRDNSAARSPQGSSDMREPTVPQLQLPLSTSPPLMVQNLNNLPVEPTPSIFLSPSAPTTPVPAQQSTLSPAQVEHIPEQNTNNNGQFAGWQHLLPSIPATPLVTDNYHYSVSSPNLQSANTQPIVPETIQDIQLHHSYIRPLDRRSQSHEIQLPEEELPLRHRRASTDPTQALATEQWRRRIEDWNEHTISERNKRSRSRCRMM